VQARLALALAAALIGVVAAAPVPVLDEESYLEIAAALDPARPYDWWRPWPPWGSGREADAFVYAHPPLFLLWVHAWWRLGGGVAVWPLKVAAALPWSLLLGWSVGRLAERLARRPLRAAALWLLAPGTVLVLQRGLMPDLMVCALGAATVAWWLEGAAAAGPLRARWWAQAGVALGLAAGTKYPALVLILPLALHARARGLGPAWALWGPALLVFGGMELALAGVYGRVHLLYVLSRMGEIPSGPALGRALGALVRLGLVLSPLIALGTPAGRGRGAAAGALAGALLGLMGAPEGSPGADRGVAVGLGALGGATVGALLVATVAPAEGRSDRSRADRVLLGAWALSALVAVAVAHKFAAPRYLAPLAAPAVLLLERRSPPAAALPALALGLAGVLGGALAVAVTAAEHRQHGAAVAAAEQALAAVPAGAPPGCFTGEWAWRWRLRAAGWAFCADEAAFAALPSGAWVLAPAQSGPGPLPPGLVPAGELEVGWGQLRVLDAGRGVGMYGETLGLLPLGLRAGPLEAATLWRVP
jgi:hypothetical protein